MRDALRDQFTGAPITVVHADVARARLPRRPFRVVANPPWALAETVRAASSARRGSCEPTCAPRWLARRGGRRELPPGRVGSTLRAECFSAAPTGAAVAVVRGRPATRSLTTMKPCRNGRI